MGDKIQLSFKVVKMKISIILYFLHLTSMSSFAQFIGTSGGFSGLLGFSGDYNYGALGRRKRSTNRISAEPDTVLTSWKPDTEETSPVPDIVEIFNESDTMVISQEPDNVKIRYLMNLMKGSRRILIWYISPSLRSIKVHSIKDQLTYSRSDSASLGSRTVLPLNIVQRRILLQSLRIQHHKHRIQHHKHRIQHRKYLLK